VRAGRPAEAEDLARLGMRFNPTLPELYCLAGRARLMAGDSDGASKLLEEALKLTRGAYMDPYLVLAGAARARKDEEGALEYWRTAAVLGTGPQNPVIVAADDERARGEARTAERRYQRAIAASFAGRGMIHFQAGRLPQAAVAWEDALAYDREMVQTRQNLGILAAMEERFDDAARWYGEALVLDRGSLVLKEGLDRVREAGRWLARIPDFERELARGPRDADALCETGNAYWHVGRMKVAEDFYRMALHADPSSARALNNLGAVYWDEGRVKEAIEAYERALKLEPGYEEAMMNLGSVYQGLGDRTKALEWARRALSVKPGNARARKMLSELEAGR
jgi:tetratricopeptide (TPR) repeat protein